VIGHEFGHMIENRMIGKGANRAGFHAGSMGEAFGDLDAAEYLNENGFMPTDGEDPFVEGAYATGNKVHGIRAALCHDLYLARFPASDIEAVERQLRDEKLTSVWTTVSFVYPLIFESRESLAVSDAIFGWGRPVYPASVPRHEPAPGQRQVFVLETVSPFRESATERCAQAGGAPPLVTEHGTLTVIEERPHR
jgi:hypothetical protein